MLRRILVGPGGTPCAATATRRSIDPAGSSGAQLTGVSPVPIDEKDPSALILPVHGFEPDVVRDADRSLFLGHCADQERAYARIRRVRYARRR